MLAFTERAVMLGIPVKPPQGDIIHETPRSLLGLLQNLADKLTDEGITCDAPSLLDALASLLREAMNQPKPRVLEWLDLRAQLQIVIQAQRMTKDMPRTALKLTPVLRDALANVLPHAA
jgi:hypothetical protein